MRVEINFSGDSSEAVISADEVTKAVRKLFIQAEETAQAVQEIRISAAQTAESVAGLRRIAQAAEQVGQEARKSRREIEEMKLSAAGGRNGVGLGPLGSGFGRVGLLGTAVGLGVATSGPLAGGAAALGLGALGLTGGALGAVGVLVGSFQGLGKAIDGDRQAFEKLSPSTQHFVQDVRSLIPWLHQLQETARAGLLPGIDQGLHAFLNPQTAGAIQQAVRGISGELGKLAQEAGRDLGGSQFQTFLHDIDTHGVTQIDNLGSAVGHLVSALLTLDHAAQPVTDWLTQVTDEGARFVDEYLKAADASGVLGEKLGGAQHELELVGHLVGALVNAAGQLATDLTPLGNQIIVDLTHALQDLAHWLDQNHDKVVEITTGALGALEETVRILAPLVSQLAVALDAVATAVGGWKVAFEIILAGTLANMFGKLALSITGVGTAAATAGGETGVGLLLARLGALAKFGGIAVPVTILVYRKDITKLFGKIPGYNDIATWVDKNIPGFGALDKAMGTGPAGFTGGGGSFDYPLASTGKLIGTPYAGTHGKAFNQAGGSDNWESENAVDIAVKQGTPVVAVEDGVIGKQIGSLGTGGRFAGLRLHLLGDSGNEYYYAHLSTILVKAGQRVKKGDPLGMSGSANGVAHLHFAQKTGNPESTISGAALASGLSAPTLAAAAGAGGSAGGTTGGPFGTPPPFTAGSKADLLPAALRLAMAKAGTTPGTADDRTAINAAVKWLRANVGGFATEDQINGYLELASLLGQLKTIGKQVTAGRASAGAKLSAGNEAKNLLALLKTDSFATATAAPQTLDAAEAHLAAVRRTLTAEITAIDKELGDKTLSAKTLAVLRAQMAQYKKTITSALTDVKNAVARQKTAFEAAWKDIADAAIASLEEQRGNYKSPARILLDQLTATHDTRALNDALDQANKDLATALKGHQADAQQQLDDIRRYVGTSFLVNAIDATQSAILGGTSQQISGQSILTTLQGLLAGGNVVDPAEVATAQKSVEEAKYQIQIAGLEKTATAEEKAYNDSVDLQEKAIRQLAANWDTYFQALHGNIAAVPGWWIAMLNQMGLTATATAISSDTGVGGSPSLALQNAHQQALAGAIDAAQYAALISGHKLEIPGLASGGAVLKTGLAIVHEGETYSGVGPNRLGSAPITVIVQTRDEALADFIDVRVEGATSQISRVQGVSADVRRRAGLV